MLGPPLSCHLSWAMYACSCVTFPVVGFARASMGWGTATWTDIFFLSAFFIFVAVYPLLFSSGVFGNQVGRCVVYKYLPTLFHVEVVRLRDRHVMWFQRFPLSSHHGRPVKTFSAMLRRLAPFILYCFHTVHLMGRGFHFWIRCSN